MTVQRKRNGQNHRVPDRAVAIGAEVGALEARAARLMRDSATLQAQAMRIYAEIAVLSRCRDDAWEKGGSG
mgnify:CR=1 FL=1